MRRKILEGLKIRESTRGARHLNRADELAVAAATISLAEKCRCLTPNSGAASDWVNKACLGATALALREPHSGASRQ